MFEDYCVDVVGQLVVDVWEIFWDVMVDVWVSVYLCYQLCLFVEVLQYCCYFGGGSEYFVGFIFVGGLGVDVEIIVCNGLDGMYGFVEWVGYCV